MQGETRAARITRRRFGEGLTPDSAAQAWAGLWLKALLAQDGSATLLCETVVGGPVRLDVSFQEIVDEAPAEVVARLGAGPAIERQVCLSHQGEAMMDNLSFVALERLDPELRRLLEQGEIPIGHLLQNRLARKHAMETPDSVLQRIWARCGLPDARAARSYVFEIEGGAEMWITEVYRDGMMKGLPRG